jgi:O-antigen biosynthesis protein
MAFTPNRLEQNMISVIIPTYKSPDALNLCLESAIEGQTNKNQIIVVVDGHYDINKDVLEKWEEHINILNLEENVGLCRGTNLGVYNAIHDKILIVNDDNVFPTNWDVILEEDWEEGTVLSPNQVEPYPSMFPQFQIEDLGRTIEDFELVIWWMHANKISENKIEETGSTLPIFMSKMDYLRVGGWDDNYELGVVADWDFFMKCQLSGLKMMRTYRCHFYHFVSLSTKKTEQQQRERRDCEMRAHTFAKYKWGSYIKHNPDNNLKFL